MSRSIPVSSPDLASQDILTDYKLSHLKIRKAVPGDVEGIIKVAASVGKSTKDPEIGFLVSDYSSNKLVHTFKLKRQFNNVDYFYVAETLGEIVGFLQAYSKQKWLEENPFWLSEVYWKPGYAHIKNSDFAVIEKTAVIAPLTGYGIGSRLYEVLFQALRKDGLSGVIAETVVSPLPNLASLRFRVKQRYELVGIRYERVRDEMLTDLVYYKKV
ncbi:MAG TPA: GNAT family N-acetyltransferase [Firmicutes bacterium]|nr:GNAT family N-acetyltransferase [Bacillota bacterium]